MKQILLDMLGELLSPTRCAACEKPGALICSSCLNAMERIDPVYACAHCGAPFGSLLCTECNGAQSSLNRCLAATVFDGPPARMVRSYKDGGERRLALEIARIMVEAAQNAEVKAPERYGGILSSADLLTFVPATSAAYKRRGFDHMELVARAASELGHACFADVLAKRGRTDQRKLGRDERRAQARGVYVIVDRAAVVDKHILLLDDVITTGATLNAAAQELKDAGAATVDALAFARVWD